MIGCQALAVLWSLCCGHFEGMETLFEMQLILMIIPDWNGALCPTSRLVGLMFLASKECWGRLTRPRLVQLEIEKQKSQI